MLARLPGARAKEIVRALERAGFLFDHQQGSHAFYRHPRTKRTTVVPIHSKELPRWLLKKIIKGRDLRRTNSGNCFEAIGHSAHLAHCVESAAQGAGRSTSEA